MQAMLKAYSDNVFVQTVQTVQTIEALSAFPRGRRTVLRQFCHAVTPPDIR